MNSSYLKDFFAKKILISRRILFAQIHRNARTSTETETETETEKETETETEAEAEAEAETETETETETDLNSDTDTDSGTEKFTGADADAEADAYMSDTERHTLLYTERLPSFYDPRACLTRGGVFQGYNSSPKQPLHPLLLVLCLSALSRSCTQFCLGTSGSARDKNQPTHSTGPRRRRSCHTYIKHLKHRDGSTWRST